MVWLWESFEAFESHVHPCEIDKQGWLRQFRRMPQAERLRWFEESVAGFEERLGSFRSLVVDEESALEGEQARRARKELWLLVHFGERILLGHRRLARKPCVEDFLYHKSLDEHWEHCTKFRKLREECQVLIDACEKLRGGLQELREEDRCFLVGDLALPRDLLTDFSQARDLFSVGMDEWGCFAAARGMERVIRKVLREAEIQLKDRKGRVRPFHEVDLFDLVQGMSQLRADDQQVLDSGERALLDFLRVSRNALAHPNAPGSGRSWRELAVMMTSTAERLWSRCGEAPGAVTPSVVEKNW